MGLWQLPKTMEASDGRSQWLAAMLARNSDCAYLQGFGSPRSEEEFRNRVPVVTYETLVPYIERLRRDEANLLFDGLPVACEKTGGSSGGCKLIPYSAAGLRDFQLNLAPWLAHTVRRHRLSGSAYFAISPVARKTEFFGRLPIGLSDDAYIGKEMGSVLMQQTAVPFAVGGIDDVDQWRAVTLMHLKSARDLELISVWSPTFLLRLCESISDTTELWPNLKVISCWTAGAARQYVDELARLFPHAVIEPKGLLSTEAVVTVPDESTRPRLVPNGYFEFRQGETCIDADGLVAGDEYEVILTTASGLYRYASGDRVRCDELDRVKGPVLEFLGRDSLSCDLVGEKLTEAFVGRCLEVLEGFATLVPDVRDPGYVLITEQTFTSDRLDAFEARLRSNPQYDYARRLGQLAPLRHLVCKRAFDILEAVMTSRGVRLGDIKPVALRVEDFWLPMFEEFSK